MNEVTMYLASRMKHISPNYLRDTETILRAWARSVGPIELQTVGSLQAWLNSRSVKPATVTAYAFQLRKFYDWAIKNGIVDHNPAKYVELPKCRKPFRVTFVSSAVVAGLINDCHDLELRYCLFAGFHAGLRFGEVVASRPSWFSINEQLLHVTRSLDWDTKDHEDRTIPLTDEFLRFLRSYGLRSPFMIASHKLAARRHRYRFDFSRRFENYVKSRGTPITFHDCRRTFASLHVSAGTSVYKVAKWLGDDVDVVQYHYGHLIPADPEINRAFSTNSDRFPSGNASVIAAAS